MIKELFLNFQTLADIEFVHLLVVISSIIAVAGFFPYIKDTLKGKTKPNRVTWFLWGIVPIIGTGAAISAGADLWGTARVLLAGILPLIVFFISFINPQSYWRLGKFDFSCGALAVIGILFWIFAGSPVMAVLFMAIADGFATLPTLKKAWTNPETETGITYVASFLSVVLIIPAISVWNIENSAFQIYLLVANGLLLFVVFRKKIGLFMKSDKKIPL